MSPIHEGGACSEAAEVEQGEQDEDVIEQMLRRPVVEGRRLAISLDPTTSVQQTRGTH